MNSYDPNGADAMSTPIEDVTTQTPQGPPTGLLKFAQEKNVDESQMADFSSPIEEVMQGPGGMIQDEVMGPPMPTHGNKKTPRGNSDKSSRGSSKNPFGMTDEQFTAAIAGLAAVIAFSKPVQGKLGSMVPKFNGDSGDLSLTGMVVSALVAAIVFYFAKQFLADKA
jgi:hypothetical protein